MLYFTKYAEQKFDILNKHKVYLTREQVEEAVSVPDKQGKRVGLLTAERDGIKVLYKKEAGVTKIITFYPIKH